MKHILLVVALLLINLNNSNARTYEPNVIYGDDDRHEMLTYVDPLFVELSLSTAAQIPPSELKFEGDNVKIKSGSFQNRMNVCSSERFAHQPSAGRCSGFLVADDLLVTAGHCIESQLDCDSYLWVFNYKVNRLGSNKI